MTLNTSEEFIAEMYASFKKAEHSMYVSLKYTRTVDVIKNLIDRFIETIAYGIEGLALELENKKEILVVPDTLIGKINLLKEKFPENEELVSSLDFMLFLRKVSRAEYTRSEEFRKNVTMGVNIEGVDYNINIALLQEYLEQLKKYLILYKHLTLGEDEE